MTNSCLSCTTKCKLFNELSQILTNETRKFTLYYWIAEKCKEYNR